MRSLNPDTKVLITGATGMIGGEMLRALLERGTAAVWALERSGSLDPPGRRLRRRFGRSGFEPEPAAARSLRAVPGDVALPRLGMSAAHAREIAAEVEIIIHCASCTSFIRERECQRANAGGVENIIEFAAGCSRRPLVVHLSTGFVCGASAGRVLGEEDGAGASARHLNGYTRTKAAAEAMLLGSGLDCLVLRPSIVLSRGIPDREFARAILWCAPIFDRLGEAPLDPAARVDIVPVDYVIEAAMRLLELPHRRHRCYNLSSGPDAAVTLDGLRERVEERYRRREPIRLRGREWRWELEPAPAPARRLQRRLRPYIPFLNLDVVFRNDRLREELSGGFPDPQPATEYLEELLGLVAFEEALRESGDP